MNMQAAPKMFAQEWQVLRTVAGSLITNADFQLLFPRHAAGMLHQTARRLA